MTSVLWVPTLALAARATEVGPRRGRRPIDARCADDVNFDRDRVVDRACASSLTLLEIGSRPKGDQRREVPDHERAAARGTELAD